MKNNVPLDVAFRMSPSMRVAFSIIMQEFEGRRFDIDRFEWTKT